MARKAPVKARKPQSGMVSMDVQLGDHSHLPRVYANYLHVSRTSHDFMLVFADVEPPPQKELEKLAKRERPPKRVAREARPVVKIAVPTHLMPHLIQALQKVSETAMAREVASESVDG